MHAKVNTTKSARRQKTNFLEILGVVVIFSHPLSFKPNKRFLNMPKNAFQNLLSDNSAATKYKEWLLQRYEDTWKLILDSFKSERNADGCQALVSAMKLLSIEGRHPFEQHIEEYYFPFNRLKQVLIALLSQDKQNTHLFERFKEFSEYLDVLYFTWKQLPLLTKSTASSNSVFALNYLDLIDAIPMTKDIQENKKLLCAPGDDVKVSETFDYAHTRKSINKVWNCVMLWEMKDPIHKKVLIVLLERILPHLEKPIHLTDFLMDSLDFGGPIGLLALQGVFTLIQKHNITYPNVYEKLYSMFEPEIFHTKFKARLFYLADIFLSSTHLPENLVAAFVKRLARLSLIAPPQDAVIILYFIGNMILRHPSLKRLIAAQQSIECEYLVLFTFCLTDKTIPGSKDPFVMEEREPSKSNAIESSLWEIVALQNHAIPSVAVAAKFISQPLPKHEWDLSTVLDLKDDDVSVK